MAALPTSIALIPAIQVQFFKLLLGLRKVRVPELQNSLRSGHERLFRRDAVDPALLGKLFVVGKAQAQQQFHCFVGFGSFGFVVGFRFAFGFWFFGFSGDGFRVGITVGGALEIVEQLFVQPKRLLPGFQFVDRFSL